jgi:hypothetical protein
MYNRIVTIFNKETDLPLHSYTALVETSDRQIYMDVASWILSNVPPDLVQTVDFRVDKVKANTTEWVGQ